MAEFEPEGEPGWRKYVAENKFQVVLGALGLFLLLIGLVGVVILRGKGPENAVEIISSDENTLDASTVMVDVAGAVQNPGVYELAQGARVNDALTAAGGFSEEADRIWVRRFVNLAQKVPDGSKLYIPAQGEANPAASYQSYPSHSPNSASDVAGAATIGLNEQLAGKVNLNTASIGELDGLWGIGEKRAQDIINNRPYSSVEELKTKAGIPSNVIERIKGEITF